MAPRPNWKGYLKLSLVSCPIALYPATSASERVSFNQINKNTGNRIRYRKVDEETEEPVEQADIIKGYQVEKNVYITLEDDELEALQVESTHTIEIDKFVPRKQLDERYLRQPVLHRSERQGRPGRFRRHPRCHEGQGHGRRRAGGNLKARAPDHPGAVRQGIARHDAALPIRGAR